jgi:hypothetical protein
LLSSRMERHGSLLTGSTRRLWSCSADVSVVYSNSRAERPFSFLLTRATGMGAMVHYDDDPVSAEVKGWNVKFYKVNRSKRHLDGTAVSSFWNNLEDWLRRNRPDILQPR